MLNRVREREKEARKQEHQRQLSIISSSSVCTPHPQTQCAMWNGVLCVVCVPHSVCPSSAIESDWHKWHTHSQRQFFALLGSSSVCLLVCLCRCMSVRMLVRMQQQLTKCFAGLIIEHSVLGSIVGQHSQWGGREERRGKREHWLGTNWNTIGNHSVL